MRWPTDLGPTSTVLIQANAERPTLVEEATADAVTKRFEKRRYDDVDRPRDNVGDDRLSTKRKLERYVEVKGSSSDCSRFIRTADDQRWWGLGHHASTLVT